MSYVLQLMEKEGAMKRIVGVILLMTAVAAAACAQAPPMATPPRQTAVPTPTLSQVSSETPSGTGIRPTTSTVALKPLPTGTPEPTPTPAPPTSTPLPLIRASCYPDSSAPLEELVMLRGPEHLFDPSCEVSGGVGEITASWDIDGDGIAESEEVDPAPLALQPGEYNPVVTFTDETGQVAAVELPRIVKVGEPHPSGRIHGVYAHLDLAHQLYANDAEIERACQFIVEAGFGSVKVGFIWPAIEARRKGSYDWRDYDAMVRIVESYGLEVHPVVGYTPEWASSVSSANWQNWYYAPPSNPADFGDFVSRLSQRYPQIRRFTVWTEPNTNQIFFRGTPEQYFEVLKAAYLALKYSDPADLVEAGHLANGPEQTGGRSVDPIAFLRSLYALGLGDYSDIIGTNPFTHPSEGLSTLSQRISTITDIMGANGDANKRINIEYGYLRLPGLSDQVLADWIGQEFDFLQQNQRIFDDTLYNLRDKSPPGSTEPDNYWGIITWDFSRKPQFAVLVSRLR